MLHLLPSSPAQTSRDSHSHRDHRHQCDHHLGLREPGPSVLLHHPVPSQRPGEQVRDGGQHHHHPLQHRWAVPQHRVRDPGVGLQQHRSGAALGTRGGPHGRAGPRQPTQKRAGPHHLAEHGDGPVGGARGAKRTGGKSKPLSSDFPPVIPALASPLAKSTKGSERHLTVLRKLSAPSCGLVPTVLLGYERIELSAYGDYRRVITREVERSPSWQED